MSEEKFNKLAEQFATNKINNGKEVKEMTNQNEKKEIKKILDISRDFVKNFYRTASNEDREWIKGRTAALMKEKGDVKYFAAFRAEFADKFFPELRAKKSNKKTSSLLDDFEAIDNE